ncbi:MAG TPA: hypothetical protein VFN73_14165 [Propionibacteriaceae bacterium]|nr:hypothetical protein [Propionibacteriaceae bacterium]
MFVQQLQRAVLEAIEGAGEFPEKASLEAWGLSQDPVGEKDLLPADIRLLWFGS